MNLQEGRNREGSRSRSRSRSRENSRIRRSRSPSQGDEEEEQFQASQEVLRSLLRIQQNRQQPIDKFVRVLWIYKGKLAFDSSSQELMTEPRLVLSRLTAQQLREVEASTVNFEKTERRLANSFASYWGTLRGLAGVVLEEKEGQGAVNPAFRAKVDDILSKPNRELEAMKQTIETTLMGRGGTGDAFWTHVKHKINQKLCESYLRQFYEEYQTAHPEEQDSANIEQEEEYEAPLSPLLGPVSAVNHRLITSEQQEVAERLAISERVFKDEFEKGRQRLDDNLSLPKDHKLLSTAIINDSTVAIDFITQEIIEFEKYKRLEDDEEEFNDWVPCESEGRFRDKKPQYINRRRATIQWNKYNSQHYNDDNPPPKAVQGYKFNIFYPQLFDKQKTPQYYLQTTESPDFCLIKFKAGPPYKDIAFKIQRREWDFTEKSGFESIFHKGILQLYFNFKKPKFRI